MRSTIEERIFLHLVNFNPSTIKRKTSYQISQKGIAETVGGSRSRVSRILRDLKEQGFIVEKKRYLNNQQNRKRKVYYLTKKGKEKEKELRNNFLEEKISVKTEDDIEEKQVEEIIEEYDNLNSILDIFVNVNNENILDLTEETNNKEIPFVDREREFKILKNKLEKVREGNLSTLFIEGGVGSGKTTLIKEFKNRLDQEEFNFLWGKAYFQTSDPYLPFKKAFKDHQEISLPYPLFKSGQETKNKQTNIDTVEAARNTMFFEFTNQLKKLSEKKPLVLFIDDIQWADKATLHLLNYIIINLSDYPVFIICAYRSEEISKNPFLNDIINRLSRLEKYDKMCLKTFNWEQTREMLSSMIISNKIAPEFVNLIHKKTEGNPLFIKEYIKLLQDEGKLPTYTSEYPTEEHEIKTPQLIEDVLNRRIDIHLSKKERKIATIGSVIGDEIPFKLLNKCIEFSELELLDSIDELLKLNILEEEVEKDCYVFTHNLIGEVLYNNISNIKKKRIHKIIAKNIKKIYDENIEEFYSDLGYHYEKAYDRNEAVKYYIKAGDEAGKVYAHDDALDMYKNALKLCADKEKNEILDKLAHVHKIKGDLEDAKTHLNSILERTEDKSLRLSTKGKLSEIFIIQGKYDKAIDIVDKGLTIHDEEDKLKRKFLSIKGRGYSRKGELKKAKKIFQKEKEIAIDIDEDKEIAKALHDLGCIHIKEGNYEKALETINDAVKIWEEIEDKKGLSDSLNNLGVIYERKGIFDKALECFQRTLEIEKEIGNKANILKTLNNLGINSKIRGDIDKALEYYDEGLTIAKKIKDKPGMAKIYVNVGIIYGTKCEFDKALEHFERALKIEKEIEDKPGMAGIFNNIGSIYHNLGDLKKAIENHKKSLEIAEEIGDKNMIAGCYYNLGSVYEKKEELDKALDYYNKSLEIVKELGNKRLYCFVLLGLADSKLQKEKEELAKDYATEAVNLSKELGLQKEKGVSRRLLGKVYRETGKLDEAKKEFDIAKKILDNGLGDIELFKLFFDYGLLYKKLEKKDEAKEYINRSCEKFDEVGMDWWLEKCKKELDHLN